MMMNTTPLAKRSSVYERDRWCLHEGYMCALRVSDARTHDDDGPSLDELAQDWGSAEPPHPCIYVLVVFATCVFVQSLT